MKHSPKKPLVEKPDIKDGEENQESRAKSQELGEENQGSRAKSQDLEWTDSVVKKSQELRAKNQDLEGADSVVKKSQESIVKDQELEGADSVVKKSQESRARSQDLEGADSVVKKSQESRARSQDLEGTDSVVKKSQESRAKNQDLEGVDSASGTPHSEIEDNSEIENNFAFDIPQSELNKSEPDSYRVENLTKESFGPKSEIKMEVHHHPEVEKKGFKEYILEGLMIFLAVTMGFFAETIRENITETAHAKELAKSLYQEVYNDSVTMQGKLKLRVEKESQLKYFRSYVTDSSLTNLSEKFYPSFAWSFVLTTSIVFDPNDGILNQLRNSGSLRYFKGTELQNAISQLNVAITSVRNRNNQEYAFVTEFTRPFLLKHYDFNWQEGYTHGGTLSIMEAILQTNFHAAKPPRIRAPGDFKREDADALAAYYLLIIRATKQVFYSPYIKANHQLLQSLRKEYHFENE